MEAGEGGAVVLIKLAREGRNKQKCFERSLGLRKNCSVRREKGVCSRLESDL